MGSWYSCESLDIISQVGTRDTDRIDITLQPDDYMRSYMDY